MCNQMQTITIVRGTTLPLTVQIADADGNAYTLSAGETLRFGVKTGPMATEYLFSKDITSAAYDGDGGYSFTIDPADTEALDFGSYWYDMGLQNGSAYYNVIPASAFNVAYNITEAV